ncbi:MAG: cupredoxin family copper-binding protein [Candidatus Moranbacteria bacterium]|nr:cupredoxin family copper-binding protein [Candidatus Moranbacteria bacterium]
MKKTSFLAFPLALLGVAFFLGGCGYQSTSQSTTPATTPASNSAATAPSPTTSQASGVVTIQNFAFSPASLTIKKGETVTWTNQDSAPHQIASDSGAFQGNAINKGESYSFTFNATGEFDYHCAIHTSMKGKIIVQ